MSSGRLTAASVLFIRAALAVPQQGRAELAEVTHETERGPETPQLKSFIKGSTAGGAFITS